MLCVCPTKLLLILVSGNAAMASLLSLDIRLPTTMDSLCSSLLLLLMHCCRALQLKLSFEASLRHILSLGGDTDTNAAIVGGLMGAYWGAAAIPADMAEAVVSRTVDSPGRQRPEFLQTKQLPELFAGLYAAAGH